MKKKTNRRINIITVIGGYVLLSTQTITQCKTIRLRVATATPSDKTKRLRLHLRIRNVALLRATGAREQLIPVTAGAAAAAGIAASGGGVGGGRDAAASEW